MSEVNIEMNLQFGLGFDSCCIWHNYYLQEGKEELRV
jgi:hypothetical protein